MLWKEYICCFFKGLLSLRLGHMPFTRMKNLYPDLDTKTSKDSCISTICPASKQMKLVFQDSYVKSTSAFELLHIDIWRVYFFKTHNGCNIFLTIVDDFTKMTWLYFMKHIIEYGILLKQLIKFIKNQFKQCGICSNGQC